MSCGEPGLVPFTDDGEWHIANGEVVMVRLDGRMVTSPLRGSCACCLAQLLYITSTEMTERK
jgi:hypothetical protein